MTEGGVSFSLLTTTPSAEKHVCRGLTSRDTSSLCRNPFIAGANQLLQEKTQPRGSRRRHRDRALPVAYLRGQCRQFRSRSARSSRRSQHEAVTSPQRKTVRVHRVHMDLDFSGKVVIVALLLLV